MRQLSTFGGLIVSFLASRHPNELEAWAASGRSMVPMLRQAFPGVGPYLVRMFLGRDGVEAAKLMDDQAFLTILTEVMDSLPSHGAILWLYQEWFLRELAELRDEICYG